MLGLRSVFKVAGAEDIYFEGGVGEGAPRVLRLACCKQDQQFPLGGRGDASRPMEHNI